MPGLNPRQARLAARLRSLRAGAFGSGLAFARAVGWQQSRVSKLETGAQLPTETDITTWVTAANASRDVEAELLELLALARVEYVNARDVQRSGGLSARQAALGALETQALRIADWQPAIIPGLVQTADYARELLALPGGPASHGASDDDIEAMVGERIRRQDILYQSRRSVQLVIGEGALNSPPGAPATLRGQLDRLLALGGLAAVDLRVLPHGVPMPVLPPPAFTLHDEAFVLVETLTAEQRLDEPDEVAVYARAFQLLHDAAVSGDAAAALIRAAIGAL